MAESCRNDVATSLHDVATFGVDFGWIFSRFLSKNPRGGDWTKGERILGVFEGEQAPFGWKHPRACSRRRLGLEKVDFVHTLGPRRRLGAIFEDLGEDHEICGRKSETHHHLIIIVSSSSFLMFYPKFMMYQTSIML